MKKVILMLTMLLTTLILSSQNQNIVRLSPIPILSKLKIHYERGISDRFSLGIIGNYGYGKSKGYKVEPFVRCYFIGGNMGGFYGQLKGYYSQGAYSNTLTSSSGTNVSYPLNFTFTNFGGSLSLGYQFLLGKNKDWAFDLYAGYQYSSVSMKDGSGTSATATPDYQQWKDMARKSFMGNFSPVLDLGISFGKKF